MRIRQLDLLRYGKFTDQTLAFPAARQDFHLVVGANEAGKSTTRSAILDLLYGIETRSTFDFLHAKAEMRLGATLEHEGAALGFVRTKARTKSLLGATGDVLADAALAPFLAGTDRAFFDQMFGLDHGRLEAGGNAILSASDDVGQILFQSAAGIASLGQVRDRLAAEADTLWARRRSNDRAYYIASDELARADAALKAATVRTRDWIEAGAAVQTLEDRRELSRGRDRALEVERVRLERVRRVAPALRQLHEWQTELEQLAKVVLLPADAARQLADTELELAAAERDQQLHAEQAQRARERLAPIHLDERLLRHAADVQALAERRQQVRHHERDIERRQAEVEVRWQQVESLVRQLGWPATGEAALIARLPALPVRAAVAGLARRFGVLDQACQTARAALAERVADEATLQAQRDGLTVIAVPPALRVALNAARALGDPKSGAVREEALVLKCQRELAAALAGLGRWATDPGGLRGLMLPSAPDVLQRVKRRADADASWAALAERHTELGTRIGAQELEITQYRNTHHPVDAAELAQARRARDAAWQDIKAGDRPVQALAAGFETRLVHADSVADQRHDKAREASEMQSKLDALDRLRQQAADTAARLVASDAERAGLDAEWAQQGAALGLAGMALHGFEPWRADRDKALRAEDALAEAQQALCDVQGTVQAASAALGSTLNEAGLAFDPDAAFETLVLIASDAVEAATAAKARRDELDRQRESAAAARARQGEKAAAAQADFDSWSAAWRAAAARAGLPEAIDAPSADACLAVMADIDATLGQIREIRQARIETMQRDLSDFDHEVAGAVAAVAPDLATQRPGAAVAELAARLAAALADEQEAGRLRHELAAHEAQTAQAAARVGRARATLRPLLQLAQAEGHDALRALIAASDRRRLVEAAFAAARKAVEEGGDGLTMDALQAEIAATDIARLPALMADIGRQIDALRHEQDALTTELTHASRQLAAIAGQADAARAESDRQDALAKMANAAERYVRVHTASRLLKWAIDRYRETRQGPMLSRAGEVFGALTLGSFPKLSVDFDSEPLTLHGQRADGALVGVAGMSDGTRDQLYLALRLAALELHLGQGHAMPFIADDLFVNYDDRRARAGLEALARLSRQTQVIFLSHHDHLVSTVQAVFGAEVNVIRL